MSNGSRRGWFLTVMRILLGILAVSDATKALQHLHDPGRLGMVIFGVRCETFAANLILGLAMGGVLGAYAYGLWNLRRWAVRYRWPTPSMFRRAPICLVPADRP